MGLRTALSLGLVAVVSAACGGNATPGASGSVEAAATIVHVTITPDGCPPDPSTIPAGPVTFKVANDGASSASEVELEQNDVVLGEKEDLPPGLSGTFSLVLAAGTYALSCPGTTAGTASLTVTAASGGAPSNAPAASPSGAVSASTTAALAQATVAYAVYVRTQVARLVTSTTAFAQAVEAGDVALAKSRYAAPRVFYERIEPVAESFGDLDLRIDGRADDAASADAFTGFHRLEQALWVAGDTSGMTPIATQLVSDVTQLQALVASATYQPAQLANGASELLDEVASSKITGEEERYSHLDLIDFQANVDGAQEAFELLRPALVEIDPALASTIEGRFTDVDASLQLHRQGDGFVLYTALSATDTRTLAQAVDALAEPLSQVAAEVVGNG